MRYGELASAQAIHSFSRISPAVAGFIRIPLSDNLLPFVVAIVQPLGLCGEGVELLTIDVIYGLLN